MICTICKKSQEETTLYPGILATRMVNICEECAEDRKIPIIRKPSQTQLTRADRTYSVRERLDRMSGRRDLTDISSDQMITQRNLSRLKMPKPKQNHPEVMDNYYWTLNMARRRAKMTLSQLARKIGTTSYIIGEIEKGILPGDFRVIFLKLEALLGIKLLRSHNPEVTFTRKNPDQEKEILEAVARKMNNVKDYERDEEEDVEEVEKRRVVKKKVDFAKTRLSRRENLSNVTLSDLIERKRERERYEMKLKQNEMMGDDLDIEEL